MTDAAIFADSCHRVSYLNEAAESLLSRTNQTAVGMPLDDLLRFQDARTGDPVSFEDLCNDAIFERSDGSRRILECRSATVTDDMGAYRGHVFVCRDVTAQRNGETEFRNGQRIESLGELSRKLAHDVNNFLDVVLLGTSVVKSRLQEKSKEEAATIERVEEECARMRELTRQLLTFAKGGAPIKTLCEPEDLLRRSLDVAMRGARSVSELRVEGSLWVAELEVIRMTQVFGNLVSNAREATADRGTILVSAKNVMLGDEFAPHLRPGPYVQICVEDEGPGIPAQNANLVFDPYFSTKPDHVGLGLTSSYAVVRSHGGLLRHLPERSKGAAMIIYLPARPELTPQDDMKSALESEPSGGHALVMEREPKLRTFLVDCLITLGCRVQVTESGTTALQQYRTALERREPFDVVFLALRVPGELGGMEVLRALQEMSSDVLAIACSADANDPMMCDPERYGFAAAIEKPYRFTEVAAVVRALGTRSKRRMWGGDISDAAELRSAE